MPVFVHTRPVCSQVHPLPFQKIPFKYLNYYGWYAIFVFVKNCTFDMFLTCLAGEAGAMKKQTDNQCER